MKALALAVALVSTASFAQAPADAPLVLESDGVTLAKGRSSRLDAGQPAPYAGQLIDDQELVRRAKVNVRNEVELKTIKTGTVIVTVPVFIAIVVGAVAAGAAVTAGVVLATKPAP